MNKKVYVVGGGVGYVNWILPLGFEVTKDFEIADLVCFTGGEDVDPSLYKSEKHYSTYSNIHRDNYELEYYKKALISNKKIIGVCRGAQFICAMQNRGHLIQDLEHPSCHLLTTYDGDEILVNSLHHQNQYLGYMKPEDYILIAWAENLSPYHLNGQDIELRLDNGKEPDIVYYTKHKALGIQNHPEMYFGYESAGFIKSIKYHQNLVEKLMTDSF